MMFMTCYRNRKARILLCQDHLFANILSSAVDWYRQWGYHLCAAVRK